MANEEAGVWGGKVLLDVSNAMAGLTALRQEHLSTFSAMGQAVGTLDRVGTAFINFGKQAAAAIWEASTAYGEFERKLDYIAVVADATVPEVEALGAQIRQLGADTIYTNDEIADGFTELAKSGVAATDILAGIGEGVTNLGAAADIGLDQAATMMMSVVQTWDMAASEATRVADVLAGTANASMVEIDDLGISMKYAGSVAASLGIEFDDVSAALGLLGKRAIRGSTAGTSLRQIMIGLVGNTQKATRTMEDLGIITEEGTNRFFDQEGQVKSLAEVMTILNDATANMGEEQRIAALKTMFNVRSLPSLLTLLDAGAEGFDEMTEAIQGVSAADVAAARLDNLSGDIEYLVGELDNLKLSFGEIASAYLRPFVQGLEELIAWFNSLSTELKALITGATAVSGALALITGGLFKVAAGAIAAIANLGQLIVALNVTRTAAGKAAFSLGTIFKVGGIGLLITLIAGLVTGLVLFFTKTEEGQAIWQKLMDTIGPIIERVKEALLGLVEKVGPVFEQIIGTVSEVFGRIVEVAGPILERVGEFFVQLVDSIGPILSTIGELFSTAFGAILDIVMPLIEHLIEAFSPLMESFSELGGPLAEAGQDIVAAMQPVAETFVNELLPALMELGQVLGETVIELLIALMPLFEALAPLVMNLVAGFMPLIAMLVSSLVPVFMQIVQTLLPALMELFVALAPVIVGVISGLMPLVMILVQSLIPAILQIVVALLPILIELFMMVAKVILAIIPAIMPLVSTILELLIPAIEFILDIVVAVFEAIMPIIQTALDVIISVVKIFTALLQGDWEGVWNGIKDLVVNILEFISQLITSVFQFIAGLFTSTGTLIKGIWETLWNGIKNFFTTIWNNLKTSLADNIDRVVQFFRELPGKIWKILEDMATKMLTMGKDLIDGLVKGIKDAGSAVMDAIGGVVTGAIDWAKGLLGIKSPSRVFRTMGEQIDDGLAIGITGSASKVENAMKKLINNATKGFQKLADDRTAALKKLSDLEFRRSQQKKPNATLNRQIAEQQKYIRDLNAAIRKESAAMKNLNKLNKDLNNFAKQRDEITSRLEAAQKNLQKLESGQYSHYGDFLDDMQKAVQVTDKRTVDGMIYSVEKQIEKTEEFNKLIASLQRRGLDQASLNELIEEFMSSGSMVAAKALAESSDDAIKQLADLRGKLGVESQKTAKTTGTIMYEAGLEAGQGLVDGLQAQLDKVNAAAKKVADTLTKTIKNQLGIKSPSRVTKAIGDDVMAGLISGIHNERQRLQSELSGVASEIASFNDQVLSTKQFQVETMLTMRASNQAATSVGLLNRDQQIIEKLDKLSTLIQKTTGQGGDTISIGDIVLSLEDLAQLNDLEEFINMIKVYKRQRGGR